LALGCKESLTIENAEAVNKSYPAFFEHLTRLGIRTDINQK
jgi:5-enolpyruvylshikimate-3-phosphate synthase